QGDRITRAGMTTEMGAKAGIVVATPEAPDWLFPDRAATYANEVTVDLSTLEPQIAVPPRVDQVVDVSAAVGQPVDVVFLGSCTNGRLVDMRQAAAVLRGRRISPEVRLEVVPSSRRQFEDAMADGTLLSLSAAGAVIGSSGCGPCLGRTGGVLAGQEICLSTANRNYRGRMGSADASIFIGSPYVAAVAALTGVIDDPRPYLEASDAEFDDLVARRRAGRAGRGAGSWAARTSDAAGPASTRSRPWRSTASVGSSRRASLGSSFATASTSASRCLSPTTPLPWCTMATL